MLTPVRSPDSNHERLARLIEILAPGESDVVAFLEAYFDESCTHQGSPALCVAGLVYRKENCLDLDLKWKEVLDRYGLPFFHMVDCAHGNPPFDKLSPQECIDVEKELIALVRANVLFGMGIAVSEQDYDAVFPDSPFGSAYSYCCWTCLSVIWQWMMANQFYGEVAYFFEAGHKSQSEANNIMNQLFREPTLRSEYRYSSHTFADKKKLRPLQSADLLAWLQANQAQRFLRKEPKMRKDYVALVDDLPIEGRFVSRDMLVMMKAQADAAKQRKVLISGMFGFRPFICFT